jgi:hypothetical protein
MSLLNKKVDKRFRREEQLSLYIKELQEDLVEIKETLNLSKELFDNLIFLYPFIAIVIHFFRC